jgi:hypothetical protein
MRVVATAFSWSALFYLLLCSQCSSRLDAEDIKTVKNVYLLVYLPVMASSGHFDNSSSDTEETIPASSSRGSVRGRRRVARGAPSAARGAARSAARNAVPIVPNQPQPQRSVRGGSSRLSTGNGQLAFTFPGVLDRPSCAASVARGHVTIEEIDKFKSTLPDIGEKYIKSVSQYMGLPLPGEREEDKYPPRPRQKGQGVYYGPNWATDQKQKRGHRGGKKYQEEKRQKIEDKRYKTLMGQMDEIKGFMIGIATKMGKQHCKYDVYYFKKYSNSLIFSHFSNNEPRSGSTGYTTKPA